LPDFRFGPDPAVFVYKHPALLDLKSSPPSTPHKSLTLCVYRFISSKHIHTLSISIFLTSFTTTPTHPHPHLTIFAMSFISNAIALLIAATLFALFGADHSVRAISSLETFASTMSLAAHLAFAILAILAVVLVCKIPIRRVPVAPIPAPIRGKKVFFEKNTLPPIVAPTYPPINITMPPPIKTPELPVSVIVDDSMDWEPTVTTELVEVPESPVSPSSSLGAALAALRPALDPSTIPFATGAFGTCTSRQRRRKAEAAQAAEDALTVTRWCHPDLYKLEASKDRPAPLKSALKVTSSDLPKKVHWQHSGMTIAEVRMVAIYRFPRAGRGTPLDTPPDRHGVVHREWIRDVNGCLAELHRMDEI